MKNRKPRILFIGTLPPPVHGSAVVSQQIKNSEVINDAFDCDWVNLGASRTIEEVGKRNLQKPFRLFVALCREFLLLLTHKYELCYLAITCYGVGFLKDSPFVLLCKLFKRRIVIHQHNKGMAGFVNKWPFKWLLPLCYKNTKVILLSWSLYPDIENVVPKERVAVCPNGIKVRQGFSNKQEDEEKPIRLLFLSNLIESKGIFVLLDALRLLKEKGYSFVCDFVGGETKSIDSRRFNEEVEKRGLFNMALYRGTKYGEDKDLAYSEAEVFVYPTLDDCFPLAILEAMEHRLPIVTTNIGGISDLVIDGENGIVVESGDSLVLSSAISKLLDDDVMRKTFGEKSWQRLNKLFTYEIFENRITSLLFDSIQSK